MSRMSHQMIDALEDAENGTGYVQMEDDYHEATGEEKRLQKALQAEAAIAQDGVRPEGSRSRPEEPSEPASPGSVVDQLGEATRKEKSLETQEQQQAALDSKLKQEVAELQESLDKALKKQTPPEGQQRQQEDAEDEEPATTSPAPLTSTAPVQNGKRTPRETILHVLWWIYELCVLVGWTFGGFIAFLDLLDGPKGDGATMAMVATLFGTPFALCKVIAMLAALFSAHVPMLHGGHWRLWNIYAFIATAWFPVSWANHWFQTGSSSLRDRAAIVLCTTTLAMASWLATANSNIGL